MFKLNNLFKNDNVQVNQWLEQENDEIKCQADDQKNH